MAENPIKDPLGFQNRINSGTRIYGKVGATGANPGNALVFVYARCANMRTGRTRAIAPALALVLPALTGKPQGMPNRCPVDHRQHTETPVVVPIVRIVPVAVVGAGVVLIVDPRPAAHNPGGRSRGTRLASQRHHYSKYIQKNRGRNTFCIKEFVGKGLPTYNKKIDRR